MKKSQKSIFCYHCGEENARARLWCKKCHKWLRPVDGNAVELGKNFTEGELKDQFTGNFLDKLAMFIQQHAFGLLFSCTLIAGVLPNLIVMARTDDNVQTVTSAPVFVAEEEAPTEEPAEEPEPPKEEQPEAEKAEEALEVVETPEPAPEPEEEKPVPVATRHTSFENVLENYFIAQNTVPSKSDFNTLNGTTFTAAERSALLSANVVPLVAGSYSRAEHSWVVIRPINQGRSATSLAYNALDLSRYRIGDYTEVGRAEYLVDAYACRTTPCVPPAHAWSWTNVREVSHHYVMLISLTNPTSGDTVYYHLITGTNIPNSYALSQYFFASVYAPDDDASVVYNFSQWFARDWYPFDYTNE